MGHSSVQLESVSGESRPFCRAAIRPSAMSRRMAFFSQSQLAYNLATEASIHPSFHHIPSHCIRYKKGKTERTCVRLQNLERILWGRLNSEPDRQAGARFSYVIFRKKPQNSAHSLVTWHASIFVRRQGRKNEGFEFINMGTYPLGIQRLSSSLRLNPKEPRANGRRRSKSTCDADDEDDVDTVDV